VILGKVLLFGGLSTLGKPIIEDLLNEGEEVVAVRSKASERLQIQEEDIEMLFGRNALFQSVDIQWMEEAQEVESVICLDSANYFSPEDFYVDEQVIIKRIKKCLETCSQLKSILVTSHIDIYGQPLGEVDERTPVSPDTDRGRHVDQIERGLIEALLQYKDKARAIQAIICRLPNIYTDEVMENESIYVKDAAKGICALLHSKHMPGIEVVQLTSGQEFSTENGKVRYRFDKAKRLIHFSPNTNE
jgi:nucleoside-diphosphate-sugar epimerase